MGKMGYGYGSEWHLLWYLGRHRAELNERILTTLRADRVEWLDFPKQQVEGGLVDREWKSLDFMTDPQTLTQWRELWPQGAGIQNWDAVGRIQINGQNEWLLVEAKAHRDEITSTCGAKLEGGFEKIRQALDATKRALGVDASHDWLNGYYQFCNRLAVLHFLDSHNIGAHLLFLYFTGDGAVGRECPEDESGWGPALQAQDTHVGMPSAHALRSRVHKLFLPIFANLRMESREATRALETAPLAAKFVNDATLFLTDFKETLGKGRTTEMAELLEAFRAVNPVLILESEGS